MAKTVMVMAVLTATFAMFGRAFPGEVKVYKKWPFDTKEAKRRQEETAAALGVPVNKTINLAKGVKLELVLLPAGEFMMGSPPKERRRDLVFAGEHLHKICITRPFYIGKHEITQKQWQALMEKNRSHFKGAKNPVEET